MLKYVSNSFHALKVTFANEIGTICKYLNVDTDVVTRIFTSDTRLNISAAYLKPGVAFGGSCLPKDLRALTHRAKELDLNLPLLTAIAPSNAEHLDRALDLVMQNGSMKIAMRGLSFKSATDDLRESPHVQLVKRLLGEGRQIRIWDQNVVLGSLIGSNRHYIEEVIPHIGSLLCSTLSEAIDGADTVVVGTHGVSRETLREQLKPEQFVVDLVNLAATRRAGNGINYQGICW